MYTVQKGTCTVLKRLSQYNLSVESN